MTLTVLPQPVVLQCIGCGCQTFYLFPGGGVECGACGSLDTGKTAGWRPQSVPPFIPAIAKPAKGEPPSTRLLQLGSSDAARRRIADRVINEHIAGCCVVRIDGTITVWFEEHIRTKEQRRWWKRKMKGWLEMMMPFRGTRSSGPPIP